MEDFLNGFIGWIQSGSIIASIIIIIVAILAWHVISRAFKKGIEYTEARDGRENHSLRVAKRVVKYGIIVVVVLALFQANGINVTSLITSLGVAGAVVGFAAQEFLKDIFMGVHITKDTFFKVGDVIQYKDYIGVVQKFTLQTTQIQDIYTKNIVSISNRNLDTVVVLSGVVDLRIGLSYQVDPEKIHTMMRGLSESLPKTVEGIHSSIYKGTSEFNDSTVNYMISVTMDPDKIPQLRRNVLMEIQREVLANGMDFPFPQLDVHFDGEEAFEKAAKRGGNN